MAKTKKNKSKSAFEMSREDLVKLDQETLAGMVMRMSEQISQLSEILQTIVREKHAPKTERFQNPEQLNIFGDEKAPAADEKSPEQNNSEPAPLDNPSPGNCCAQKTSVPSSLSKER